MTRRTIVISAIAGVALAGSLSCTSRQSAPELSGPSELATSIAVYANPDSLTQDGAAQAQITILARNSASQPITGLPIRLDTSVNGVVADFGQLATKQVVTGSDGRASVIYTAPGAARTPTEVLTAVTIVATPVGTDASASIARSITIRLSQPGIVIPPTDAARAVISLSPSVASGGQTVACDGSASSSPYGIVNFAWDFGDGSVATGSAVSHAFPTSATQKTYTVRLTVTDGAGQTASSTQSIVVNARAGLTAVFYFSPTSPTPDQPVYVNGSDSSGPNPITSWAWDFGDGSTPVPDATPPTHSGPTPAGHLFAGCTSNPLNTTDQIFIVRLSVTDSAGQTASTTNSVTVKKCKL